MRSFQFFNISGVKLSFKVKTLSCVQVLIWSKKFANSVCFNWEHPSSGLWYDRYRHAFSFQDKRISYEWTTSTHLTCNMLSSVNCSHWVYLQCRARHDLGLCLLTEVDFCENQWVSDHSQANVFRPSKGRGLVWHVNSKMLDSIKGVRLN